MSSSLWAEVSDLPLELQDNPAAPSTLEYATFVLWSLSGRRYSPQHSITEAYDTRQTLYRRGEVYPMFYGGKPYNTRDCEDCVCAGCGIMHRTRLRQSPVRHILDVVVDGKLLTRNQYVLLDYAVLGIKSGDVCGADCVSVRYVYGTGVPPGGRRAAARLAEELLRASLGEDCALPERVTSVSRQGMTWTLLDPQEFLADGRTGIYEIDLLLASLNPAKALARPRVFNPDVKRAEVHNITPPPMSLILQENDQAFISGLPAVLITRNAFLLHALINSGLNGNPAVEATARLKGSSDPLPGVWVLAADKQSASFGVSEYVTATIPDGTSYIVELEQDFVFSGRLRTFP